MRKILVGATVGLLFVGQNAWAENSEPSTADKAKQTANKVLEDAKTGAFDLLDKDINKVTFEKGSAVVTDSERSTLRSVVNAVRDDAQVKKVIVVAWADTSLPLNSDSELDKDARDLAKTRAENVEKILEELGVADVDSYSMAEQPSWFGKIFRTDDAQIKESMKGKQVSDADTAAIAETLKAKGGPSSAVVIVRRDYEDVSH